MRKLGLDSSQPSFESLSPVPQAQVVLAFDKKAIDQFFDSGLGTDTQDLKVFSKGDGRLISFTHELGVKDGGRSSNEIKIKIIDHDNYFVNSLFDRKFDEVLNQARDIVGLEPFENNISTNAKSIDFDYSEDLNQAIKGGLPKFYIAYGLGSNTHHWAGPFVCHLVDGVYQESGNDVLTLELKFIPEFRSDIVPNQTGDKGNQVSTEIQKSEPIVQFNFNTSKEKGSMDRKLESASIRWLATNLQNALERCILKYFRSCGYNNVLLLFSDVDKALEDRNYDKVSGTIKWKDHYTNYGRVRIDSEGTQYAITYDDWRDMNAVFDTLGIEVSLPQELSSEKDTDSNTYESKVLNNPFITNRVSNENTPEETDEMSNRTDNIKYAIGIRTPKQGESVFQPVLDLLNNMQDQLKRLINPIVAIEANSLIIDEWRKAHANYITDPDEPVVVIGEDALIQKVLYKKQNSALKVSDYIELDKPCVVSFIAKESEQYGPFMEEFHVSKRGKGFFDYDSVTLPDEFSWYDRAAVDGFAVPVFKINSQNPNVLRFTAKSKGIFFSTLAGTCQTIAAIVKESLTDSPTRPYISIRDNMKNLIQRVLQTKYNEGNTNNIREFAKAPPIDFEKIANDVTDLVVDGNPVGPSPVSTGNDITAFLAYINNFYRLFNNLHVCSIKTVPYFNLSELSLMHERCILLKNLITPVAEKRGPTKSIYTGIWSFRSFKHVISNTDAYSEFGLYKMPFEFEDNGDKGTITGDN